MLGMGSWSDSRVSFSGSERRLSLGWNDARNWESIYFILFYLVDRDGMMNVYRVKSLSDCDEREKVFGVVLREGRNSGGVNKNN